MDSLKGTLFLLWRLGATAKHDLCRKDAILVGKSACSTVFFRKVLYRLNTNAVASSFGGGENTVFLLDLTVKSVFHFDQKQTFCVQVGGHLDLPPGGGSAQTGFQRIFQQVGK